jgi:purine nucleoside permease
MRHSDSKRGQHSVRWPILLISGLLSTLPAIAAEERIPVKVIVAAMFENGETTGDVPGELQLWVERLELDEVLPFPLGERDLFLNDEGVMAVLLGGGIANATASVMALGTDPRFDLSQSYWLIAGVAGGDPADLSLGSAAWARHVIDGDLAYEIDAREIPPHWPYGMVPLGAQEPTDNPADIYTGWTLDTISFQLNESLVDWAYALTKDADLGDSAGIASYRALFEGFPQGQRPPFVTVGDTLSASTYWHGRNLNTWANDWVRAYAGTDANFMTSNMEDSGTLTAIHRLAREGIVDAERVLVLRTASNYTIPPPGKTAQWSRSMPYPDGGLPALESAFTVGNIVVQALLEGWDDYAHEPPRPDSEIE